MFKVCLEAVKKCWQALSCCFKPARESNYTKMKRMSGEGSNGEEIYVAPPTSKDQAVVPSNPNPWESGSWKSSMSNGKRKRKKKGKSVVEIADTVDPDTIPKSPFSASASSNSTPLPYNAEYPLPVPEEALQEVSLADAPKPKNTFKSSVAWIGDRVGIAKHHKEKDEDRDLMRVESVDEGDMLSNSYALLEQKKKEADDSVLSWGFWKKKVGRSPVVQVNVEATQTSLSPGRTRSLVKGSASIN